MNIRHTIFPILFATTISAFASSSSTMPEQEAEQNQPTNASNHCVKWVVLGNLNTESSAQKKLYLLPGHHLVEKFNFSKTSKNTTLTINFRNFRNCVDPFDDSGHRHLMKQMGTLIENTEDNTASWRVQNNDLNNSQVMSAVLYKLCEGFLCDLTMLPVLSSNLKLTFGIPSDLDLEAAHQFVGFDDRSFLDSVRGVKWVPKILEHVEHTLIPLGSKGIKKISWQDNSLGDLGSDYSAFGLITLETFQSLEKLKKEAEEQKKSSEANQLALLQNFVEQDPKDPCVFKIPGEFINTQRNWNLFLKLLGTLEPTVNGELKNLIPEYYITKTDEPPYDITF